LACIPLPDDRPNPPNHAKERKIERRPDSS
jgi:hypothetical protein